MLSISTQNVNWSTILLKEGSGKYHQFGKKIEPVIVTYNTHQNEADI